MRRNGISTARRSRSAFRRFKEIENGKTGLIFETGNIDSLIKCLEQYETMDIMCLQRNILESFDASSYSLRTHCRNLLNVYNS